MRLRIEQGGGYRHKDWRTQSGRNEGSKMTLTQNEDAGTRRSTHCLLTGNCR